MIFGKTKLELKVGFFVLIGIIILAFFVLSIGNMRTWAQGYRLNFIFNFVNGVKIGAPVRFAGVDVGEVKKIYFYYSEDEQKDKIKINCWLKKYVRIPVDSTIWVNTLGLLGEKYVEIMPGTEHGTYLAEDQDFVGVDPIPMHEVFRLGKNIADVMNETFKKIEKGEGTLGKLIFDETLYNELEAAVKHRQGTIGRFLYDDSIYKKVEELVQDADGLISDIRRHPWKLFWKTKEKKPKK